MAGEVTEVVILGNFLLPPVFCLSDCQGGEVAAAAAAVSQARLEVRRPYLVLETGEWRDG